MITTVRAELSSLDLNQNNIQYSFVDQGCLTDRAYEFQMKSSTGQIYLAKKLNRSVNLFREVEIFFIYFIMISTKANLILKITLAASYSKSLSEAPIIVNQYLCIKILTLDNNQPCFPTTPVGLFYHYQLVYFNF